MSKKSTSVFLDDELVKKLDEWRKGQSIFMSRTAVITCAIRQFLEKNKVKFYDPMEVYKDATN